VPRRFFRSLALGLALLLAQQGISFALAAKGDVFTVGNYPVQAVDKNAVAAKDKALGDGQQGALRSLLKRIVPVTAYKQLARVAKVKANELISGVSVRSERNSSTEYIANLDFSFQADAVRSVLSREGIPFVEAQAPPVVIIPIVRQGNPAEIKSDNGAWRDAWKGLDLEHTLTPLKLDELKSIIHSDTVQMLLNGDDNALRILAGEYKADRILLAVAEPDLPARKMVVTLAGQDAVGPFLLKRSYRISDGDYSYTTELAAVVSLGVLEGRWKIVKSPTQVANAAPDPQQPAWSASAPSADGEHFSLVAEFISLAQWNDMRSQLLDTPGVENLDIPAVSARNADVSLNYPGGPNALANALGARGLQLQDSGAGWTLRSMH
jgi:hypothetical protein